MPLANNQGVQINYEVTGYGPPLFLMHGFSGNHTSWHGYGYVAALQDSYQLILIDARGHGASSKPHTPEAYDYQRLIEDMIAVLDDLHSRDDWLGTYWRLLGTKRRRRTRNHHYLAWMVTSDRSR
jgi:pimeloyl-ACP methyl ester carboxylesterase